MKKNGGSFINIGTSSVLTIFVVICLVTFAMLSWLLVDRDAGFAEEEMTRSEAYFAASEEAQKKIGEIDSQLLAAYQNGALDSMDQSYSFEIAIDDDSKLSVELAVCDPETNDGKLYKITKYQENSTKEWNDSEGMNLMEFDD